MSVSPKYRTNFSVTDILSPLDETASLPPPRPLKPYSIGEDSPSCDPHQQANGSGADSYLLLNSIGNLTDGSNNNKSMSVPVSTPFGVHQLGMHSSHPPPPPHSGGGHIPATSSAFSTTASSQYVNGATELSASAYGVSADVRASTAPWYSTSGGDPRFATDYTLSTGKIFNF